MLHGGLDEMSYVEYVLERSNDRTPKELSRRGGEGCEMGGGV